MRTVKDGSRVSHYEYDLPEGRIARYPAETRDASRLLVVSRAGGALVDSHFSALPTQLRAGDLLVVNETRVLPARLLGRKPTGAAVEILLLRPAPGGDDAVWEALVRPGRKLRPGRTVEIGPGFDVEILDSAPGGGRVVRLLTDEAPLEAIERFGTMPLPPYLDRPAEALDRERYQTVYARCPGSAAAPTAGLHFSETLLQGLRAGGVETVAVTLDVGVGTFRPVEADDPLDHEMHAESYDIPEAAADAVDRARAERRRVVAVGTTVVRTLESAATAGGSIRPGGGSTRLFLYPPHELRVIDALITNFHLPRSTLLMLVAAFAGYERTMAAYDHAVAGGYRFYSYGDAMFIA